MSAFQKLGRYLIVDEIASGGMATIYRAKLIGVEGFEKEFAIKKILPFWSHQKEFIDMLVDEAKVLVPLHHNNIVQVFELSKEGDHYFIVMEYVDGFDLKTILSRLRVQNKKIPLDLSCQIVKQICVGLEFAHTRKNKESTSLNIVHRDISPQNILISREGEVKITDFGIAKIIGKSSETATGVLKGKFSYMSPEQAMGADIDARTDVFALGALFYEMVFGKKCFDGRNDFEIIERVKNADVSYSEDTINPLLKILTKALARDKNERTASASEMRANIEKMERDLGFFTDNEKLKNFLSENFSDTFKLFSEKEKIIQEKTKRFLNEEASDKDQDLDVATRVFVPASLTLVDEKTVVESVALKPQLQKQGLMTVIMSGLIVVLLGILIYVISAPKPPLISKEQLTPPVEAKAQKATPTRKSQSIMTTPAPIAPIEPISQVTAVELVTPIISPLIEKKITYGSVRVTARPWGKASVSGVGSRETPAFFKAPSGQQIVSVYFPPSKINLRRVIEIGENKVVECRASFSGKGSLECK
jgi:serine/threonine protein kinase